MSRVPSIVQANGEMTRSRAGVPLLNLNYTCDTHLQVYYRIEFCDTVALEVFGDGANGSYEWVLLELERPSKHSDAGYGDPSIALRDGLIEYHGQPDATAIAVETDLRKRFNLGSAR